MTKLNRDNSATTTTDTGAKVRRPKAPAKTSAFPVALKSLARDIIASNPNFHGDTKKMRVMLRAKIKAHDRNEAWVFNTQAQYDAARSLFDAAYAAKIAKPARAKKVKAPVEPVEA